MSATRWARAIVVVVVCAVWSLPALAGFRGIDVFLPMVGRRPGIHPSNWYTKVWVYNPNAQAVDITIYLLQRSTSNPNPPFYTDTIQAGDTRLYENAVFTLFGVEVYGAMRVVATDKVVVSSRVYSQATGLGEEDSVGQFFAGVPASYAIGFGESSEILGVHQTVPSGESEFRYNFGFVETTGNSATVRVTAWDETGAVQGQKDLSVREWSQRQVAFKDHFPAVSTENSRLTVEVVAGEGKIIAYGSGLANGSQDPSTFEMTYPELPVVSDATLVGDGTEASPLGLADGAVTLVKLGTTNTPTSPTSLGAEALAASPVTVLTSNGSEIMWGNAGTGDITSVAAGPGLTGGGVEDEVTLAVGAGPGIEVQSDHVTIATAGVTAGMLANGAVTSAALGTGSVITSKLQDAAVTTAKIADSSVGSAKIIDGSIGPQDIADGSVTLAKISTTGASSGQVIKAGSPAQWSDDGLSLPYRATTAVPSNEAAFILESQGLFGLAALGACRGLLGGHYGDDFYDGRCAGVSGQSGTRLGVVGSSREDSGVAGTTWAVAPHAGVVGESIPGTGFGVRGLSQANRGVSGESVSGYGTYGSSSSNHGVVGVTEGFDKAGVLGENLATAGRGVLGHGGAYGVQGYSETGDGVFGQAYTADKSGIYAINDHAGGYAGYFRGRLANNRLTGSGNRAVYSDSLGVLTNSSSDAALKRDVTPLNHELDVLEALGQLRGVAFNWDTSVERAKTLGDQREIGMIAQEVELVLPQLVGENADGSKSVDYPKLTAFLIEVAKAQQAQISELKTRIHALEATPTDDASD